MHEFLANTSSKYNKMASNFLSDKFVQSHVRCHLMYFSPLHVIIIYLIKKELLQIIQVFVFYVLYNQPWPET